MKDLPEHVAGVRAVGHVNKDDYKQTLVPAIKKAIEKVVKEYGEINFLMLLETDISNLLTVHGCRMLK